MGPHLTLARVEQCLQRGGIPADLDHAIAEAAVRTQHVVAPLSGKLRLDLLYEGLHSRQRALVRLR